MMMRIRILILIFKFGSFFTVIRSNTEYHISAEFFSNIYLGLHVTMSNSKKKKNLQIITDIKYTVAVLAELLPVTNSPLYIAFYPCCHYFPEPMKINKRKTPRSFAQKRYIQQ